MMQGIFNTLEPIINQRLEDEKENLFAFLGDMDQKLQRVLDFMKDIEIRLKKVESTMEIRLQRLESTTFALGKACHEAFIQTKEAAECLREELGEASGCITEATWPDSAV